MFYMVSPCSKKNQNAPRPTYLALLSQLMICYFLWALRVCHPITGNFEDLTTLTKKIGLNVKSQRQKCDGRMFVAFIIVLPITHTYCSAVMFLLIS